MSEPGGRPLLLGLGWPPDTTGGLDRYYRELFEALGSGGARVQGLVVGPVSATPAGLHPVSRHDAPLTTRLRAFTAAATHAAREADVVDAHFALYAALPVRRAPLRDLPLVVHFHGPWAAESEAQHTPGARPGVRARARRRLRAGVERSVYRRAHRAVTLSGAFARVLVQEYGVSPWRVRIVPPSTDLQRFTPGSPADARARLGLAGPPPGSPDGPVVVSVRRLVPRTGVDVLLDAWAQAGITDGRLVIVGDGPERRALEQQARALGRADVTFAGAPDDATLVDWYRAADLTVVPSRTLEGYGLVVLESLACGTPVLVTDAGGLPEAVAALDPGLVVPAADAAALAARLRELCGGPEPVTNVPDAARCRAFAERHGRDALAANTRAVYAEAIAASTGTESPRPRVLFVDHVARLSGGEVALARLLEALDGAVDAHVVTFELGPLLVTLGAAGITSEVVAMPARTTDLSRARARGLPLVALYDSTRQVLRLARRLRQLRPDVVHANSLKSCLVAGVAARLARVPCVWHVRDLVTADEYGRLPAVAIRRLARRLPATVVANSDATLAALRLPAGARPARVVVPDPLPDAFFAPADGGPAAGARVDGELVVGIVGRLAPWKGQHVFLDAFAEAFPHGGARAHVVGDALFGEHAYRDELHAQAQRLGIADRVEFRGFRHDIRRELAALDVLVHATVTAEPFGQVVVEGMAAGLPVVATDAGGPAEIVTDGVDGLLVPPGDTATLAAVLDRLARNIDLRRTLGRRAREHAARYRAAEVAPRVLDVYARLGPGR